MVGPPIIRSKGYLYQVDRWVGGGHTSGRDGLIPPGSGATCG
jgi:hypothetical protein